MNSRARYVCTLLTGLLLVPLLVACGGGNGPSEGLVPINGIGATVPTRDPAHGFKVTVATDKAAYTVGDQIKITVSVTNADTVSHTLAYPNQDPIVRWGYIISQNGKIVAYEYNTAHNQVFNAALSADVYAPGQTMTFNYVFPYLPADNIQKTTLSAGAYQVYARQADLTYDGTQAVRHTVPTPASDPVTITVTQ